MAVNDAMVALYSATLAATTSSVTIAGIPATGYRDLRLVISGSLTVDEGCTLRFNGDTGSNYSEVSVNARASGGLDSGTGSGTSMFGDYYNAGVRFMKSIDIFDYSQVDKQKSALCRTNAPLVTGGPTTGVQMIAGRWASTAAVSSLSITCGTTSQFAIGSTFTLYGIKA